MHQTGDETQIPKGCHFFTHPVDQHNRQPNSWFLFSNTVTGRQLWLEWISATSYNGLRSHRTEANGYSQLAGSTSLASKLCWPCTVLVLGWMLRVAPADSTDRTFNIWDVTVVWSLSIGHITFICTYSCSQYNARPRRQRLGAKLHRSVTTSGLGSSFDPLHLQLN